MGIIEIVFGIAVLILSIVIHEVSHGYAANSLGDPTAKLEGRLTLNPVKHLDMTGSFIVPVFTYFIGGFIFGWAKPVPYNPYNIKHKWGDAIVAAAGPLSNILIALVFGLVLRLNEVSMFLGSSAIDLIVLIVYINILLAVFNLIPIPPLDGSKILFNALPQRYMHLMYEIQRYWIFIIVFFLLFLWRFIFPIIEWVFELFTGISM